MRKNKKYIYKINFEEEKLLFYFFNIPKTIQNEYTKQNIGRFKKTILNF